MKYLYFIFIIKIINRFIKLEKLWNFLKSVKIYYKNVFLPIMLKIFQFL